jgi:hypothetical protein
MVDLNVLHK